MELSGCHLKVTPGVVEVVEAGPTSEGGDCRPEHLVLPPLHLLGDE